MGLVLFSFVSYYLYIYIFFFFFFFVTIVTTVTTFSPRYFQRFAMGEILRPPDPLLRMRQKMWFFVVTLVTWLQANNHAVSSRYQSQIKKLQWLQTPT
jgi:hypothetical protein